MNYDNLEEALGASFTTAKNPGALVVDSELRTIQIPSNYILGVYNDKDVLTLPFQIPRFYHGTDLSEFEIKINYMNASGIGNYADAKNVVVADDAITFDWLLGAGVFAESGTVTFVICIRKLDSSGKILKEFNTTRAVGNVLEGLEVEDPEDPEQYSILFEMRAYDESARTQAENAAASATLAKAYVGAPLTANTATAMTDTTRVYVYTGSETGYTAGNWYYHDGSTWQSGGTYNSSAVETDKSLSISDKAADAKVVGDKLTEQKTSTDAALALKADKTALETEVAARVSVGDEVTALKADLIDTEYAIQAGFLSLSTWVNGSWSDGSSPTPKLTNATDRIRTNNFIKVYKGDVVRINNASLYGHAVGVWRGELGSASNVRSDQSFNTNNEEVSITEDGFMIVVFADASNHSIDLDPSTFAGSIAIDTYASKEIQKTNDTIGRVVSKGDNRLVYTDEVVNNIICPYDVKRGYYVNADGVELASADWSVTYFIPVTAGEPLYFGNTGLTCFYDENHDFISYRTGSYTSYTVPNDAAYMRVSVLITALSTAAVNRGTAEKSYDDGLIHYTNRFKPYESGYIYFTVPVNQYNWNRNANMGTDRATLDKQDWLDVNCYIKLPGTYTKSGQPTKLLMLCHGAGKGIKTTDSDDNWCGYEHYDNLVSAFMANGYAVFDCNGYANTRYACSFWGNRRGVQAWKNAYQYIIDNYNVEHQFSIYAFSMGGLTAMAIASDLYPNIKCMALGSPVTSLKAMWDEGNNAVIAEIYGMASSSVYDESKVLGCDPQKSIITIDNTDYFTKQLPPVKAWFGTLETQPSPTDCSKMINAIKNTNGIAQLRMVDNATHSICFGAEPLITAEYVMWINRWNSIGKHN